MLSEVDFASFAYGGVKSGNPSTFESIFKNFNKETKEYFKDFLNQDTVLIPVPRSSLLVEGGLWPGYILAKAFLDHGYAKSVSTCIKRVRPLQKSSSFTSSYERPSVQAQLESLEVAPELLNGNSITLIDDVVTAGRTAFACALKLKEAFPEKGIRVFAVIRTESFKSISTIVDKCIGKIIYYEHSGKTYRQDEPPNLFN